MNKITITFFTILAVLTLSVLSAHAQCESGKPARRNLAVDTTITGQVQTPFLVPVVNARVTLMRQSILGASRTIVYTSAPLGEFRFDNAQPCSDYVITVEYGSGFLVDTRNLKTDGTEIFPFYFIGTIDNSNWSN